MPGKILFVDDSPVIKKVVKRTVENMGYEFIDATNGKEALDILAKEMNNVIVILSDWNMPVMNGFDFLKAVKSNKSFQHIPVIMITTESEKSNINKALEAGAANYIIKPFNGDEVVKKVTQCANQNVSK
jgi:two-component system, chemotaxis family, chemotaxis protein CheY